jgi:hypothetical protein
LWTLPAWVYLKIGQPQKTNGLSWFSLWQCHFWVAYPIFKHTLIYDRA